MKALAVGLVVSGGMLAVTSLLTGEALGIRLATACLGLATSVSGVLALAQRPVPAGLYLERR